jgi:nicotinate-nucleotide--dimethylbenzimidazole phosphoribosyltransferase
MLKFKIQKPSQAIVPELIDKIDNLTKPKGSLGRLEEMALQIGTIQQTLSPALCNPFHVVFGGDHGIVAEGVSYSPAEVTLQMVFNFMEGGAGINFLARQHSISLKVVDAGINYDFKGLDRLIDLKVRKGTRNFMHEAAMTAEEFNLCIERGAQVAEDCYNVGCNIISFGEMGIGNTSPSSMWMTCLTGIPLEKCVGAGSGFDNEGVKRKYTILQKSLDNYKGDHSLTDILCYFGGLEMAMAMGAMLKAAELNMVILIDGFIMTNCILAAFKLYPEVLNYCIFGHQGDEGGHKLLLEYLHSTPLLNFGLRLGEGTGALCAYPLVESSVRMINEMSTFRKASVTKYF